MWSAFIVVPIIAIYAWIGVPLLLHIGWWFRHGKSGYDRPPTIMTYWTGGGMERLMTPDFRGNIVGSLGDESDYEQSLLVFRTWELIKDIKSSTTTLDPDAAKENRNTFMSDIASTLNNMSTASSVRNAYQRRIRHEVQQMSGSRLNLNMDELKEKLKARQFTKKQINFVMQHITNANNANTASDLMEQTTIIDGVSDPILRALLRLTEDKQFRIHRDLSSKRSWETAKMTCCGIVYYAFIVCFIYIGAEMAYEPQSIFFGSWMY
jgi:hypothetical protein